MNSNAKSINIGLLGFGNVGTGTYMTLEMNRSSIKKQSGIDFQIKKILVRDMHKDRDVIIPKELFTHDPEDIFSDPEIDIVVELLGGVEPATEYMLKAMSRGKHVVSANKAAIAANYETLREAASNSRVMLRYEASVGAGIPVLTSLNTTLRSNNFTEVQGILNGTTNYILTQMTDNGMEYEDVLKIAQEKGFAEADPTADVEGIDAANKLSILIALVYGLRVAPENIPTEGITEITRQDIKRAARSGKKIKLIATAKNENGNLTYSVRPTLVAADHPLAGVNNEFNAIFVKGNAVGELMFYGKGAGPLPTGSAVVGDIIEIGTAIMKNAAYDLVVAGGSR